MGGLNPILIVAAVILAGVTVGVAKAMSVQMRALFGLAILALMCGIYVGFAIISADAAAFISRPVVTVMMMESLTALALIFIGLNVVQSPKPWVIGVLILVHGAVDLAHMLLGTAYTPNWYEFVCLIYDGIVGAAFIMMLGEHDEKISEPTPSL